jgi:hypothetical protein
MTSSNHDSLSSCTTGIIQKQEAEKSTHLNELKVRKPFVESISQGSEELRLHNMVENLTSSTPRLNLVSSNAYPD